MTYIYSKIRNLIFYSTQVVDSDVCTACPAFSATSATQAAANRNSGWIGRPSRSGQTPTLTASSCRMTKLSIWSKQWRPTEKWKRMVSACIFWISHIKTWKINFSFVFGLIIFFFHLASTAKTVGGRSLEAAAAAAQDGGQDQNGAYQAAAYNYRSLSPVVTESRQISGAPAQYQFVQDAQVSEKLCLG